MGEEAYNMPLITKTLPSSNNQFIKEVTQLALQHQELFSAPKIDPTLCKANDYGLWVRIPPSDLTPFLSEENGLESLGITQVRILTNNDLRRGWSVDIDLSNQSHCLNWVQGGQVLSSSLVRPIFKGKEVYYVSK